MRQTAAPLSCCSGSLDCIASGGSQIQRSRYRSGWRRVRELPDRIEDAQPDRNARKIAIRRQLVGSFDTFRHGLIAVSIEHQIGYPPDFDFRYHADRLAGGTSIYD